MATSWRRWLDFPELLRTPVGRAQILGGTLHRAWPLMSPPLWFYRRTALRKTRIVAVTGSYGKSTAVRSIVAALGERVHWKPAGNHKAGIAQALFQLRPADRNTVMEIGIDGPEQMGPLARVVRPDVTVVTSIGTEHHRSLGTLEKTRDEKADLVRALSPSGLAVLNGDDPNVRWMAEETRAKVVLFGLDPENDIRARDLELEWPHRMQFGLETPRGNRTVRTRLIGRYMVYPILAAVATALAEGCDLDECLERLERQAPTPGRMEVRQLENGATLLCDYFKSSYETITAALEVFEQIPAKRRIVVMGEVSEPPGSQGPIYREIGERIARVTAWAVFLGHNFQRYKAGATRGGLPATALTDAGNSVLRAVESLRGNLGPGDVILIKGRDTQKLDRIACALEGRRVRCEITFCQLGQFRCHACPMLERGWGGRPGRT